MTTRVHMLQDCRRWVLVLALFCGGTGPANAAAAPACAQEEPAFDGLTALEYVIVKGESGSHLDLHPEHPARCTSPDEGGCKSHAYVISGDTLAVAAHCGSWAYAQYLGEKHVTAGWVDGGRLEILRPAKVRENKMMWRGKQDQPRFELTKGRGVPVCEAYLQRLNQTEFEHPAYCGLPEDDRVPGFARLQRRSVTVAESNQLYDLIDVITHPIDDIHDYDAMNEHNGVFVAAPGKSHDPPFNDKAAFSSWRYEPPIDIDNDGQADNVLIWGDDDDTDLECGGSFESRGPGHIGFVLTADGKTIDQRRTIDIFGHPDGGYPLPFVANGKSGPVRFMKSYRVIGTSYSLFKFRNLTYFDTFFDDDARLGDFHDERRNDPKLVDTLGVFLRKDGKTQQLCEYYVPNQALPVQRKQ